MQREGAFREMKRRRFYEKPSDMTTRKKNEAIRRGRKLARKQARREGLIPSPRKKTSAWGRRPDTGNRQITADIEEGVAMATRENTTIKTKFKDAVDAGDSGPTAGQQKRAETAQFRLQVDRQTKASYAMYAAAEGSGLGHQRGDTQSVFDAVAGVSTVIEPE